MMRPPHGSHPPDFDRGPSTSETYYPSSANPKFVNNAEVQVQQVLVLPHLLVFGSSSHPYHHQNPSKRSLCQITIVTTTEKDVMKYVLHAPNANGLEDDQQ